MGIAWAPELGVGASIYVDGLSALFALLIAGVGALVLAYSGAYLRGAPERGRFFGQLLLFAASMLGVVVAGDLFLLYVFWELTSLSSFLLIGTDHRRRAARAAAIQAMLVTTGGGLALLAGLVLLADAAGTSEIAELLHRGDAVRAHPSYPAILALILAGAFTKSAQIPLHFWLPAAMEAPAPVSAYLHSATMVKAGVFLIARLHPVLGGSAGFQAAVVAFGAATLLGGALLALPQRDLKRGLAYLTVSALGLITMLLGSGTDAAIEAAMTYVVAHALYKGALFLVAGNLDHETGTRDVERMAGVGRLMPRTAAAALVAALSLAGLPPLFGFIAKELAYGAPLRAEAPPGWLGAALAGAVALAGAAYAAVAARLSITLLRRKDEPETPKRPHEAPPAMWIPPALLAAGGLLLGLWPDLAGEALIRPAASAIAGRPVHVDLALWHGAGAPLALSAASVALGAGLYLGRERIDRAGARLRPLAAFGPAQGYARALRGLGRLAEAHTRLLQNGLLRRYVFCVLAAAAGLVGFALLFRGPRDLPPARGDAAAHELATLALAAAAAVAAAQQRSRMSAIVALGAVGALVSLLFALRHAPDVAMTQVLVETLIVVVVVLIFLRLPPYERASGRAARVAAALLSTAIGAGVALLALAVRGARLPGGVAPYYVERAIEGAHAHNVVNAILVDFRALDTLGEITVLAVASFGIHALLRIRGEEG